MEGTTVPKSRIPLDKEKYKAAILYILGKCSGNLTFGKTVLWKMLYFSDFDSYEMREVPITGETYYKLPHGPAPGNFDRIILELKAKGLVKEQRLKVAEGKEQIKFLPLAEPDLSALDGREIEILDRTIAKLSSMNATQVSAFSHQDMPWKATKMKEKIDYELVFYRDAVFSVREQKE